MNTYPRVCVRARACNRVGFCQIVLRRKGPAGAGGKVDGVVVNVE